MKRRTFVGAVGGGGLLLGGGYLGFELFAPERATRASEERTTDTADTAGTGGTQVLKTGTFVGKANHRCSGTVELGRDESGAFVQFRDYDQTQGPDVFCYLTPEEDPDTSAAIDAGTKVLIEGGADGGEMTKMGTFFQSLSDDVVLEDVRGVAIWCDRFSVPFGAATLTPSS